MQVSLEQQKKRSSEFLAQRHKTMAYLISLVGDPHVAEDIFQEIWMKLAAYQKDDIENTAAWCRAVGKNLVLHHWRDKGRQKLKVNSELMKKIDLAFEEDDDEDSSHRERKEALQNCMKDLPDYSKNLLDQKYSEGKTFSQIADKMGKSESSLMMTVSRIRRKLQECIEQRIKSGELAI